MLIRIVVTLGGIITGICYAFKVLYSICWNGLSSLTVKKRKCPPLLLDEKYGIHKYVTLPNQGIKLHYVEKGDPSKKLILFVHGFPEFWFAWCHQIEGLSKNYRTIAIDLRGYGDSDKPKNKEAYEMLNMIEDVKEFIEINGGNCILVTHDWGTLIGWEFLQRYPHLVEKCILLNGSSFSDMTDLIGRNLKQTISSNYGYAFQLPFLPEIGLKLNDFEIFKNLLPFASDEDLDCYKYTYSQPGGFTPPLNYYRCLSAYKPLPRSSRMKVSCLVIWGMQCQFIISEMAEKLRKSGDNVQVKYLQDAGHFCQIEDPKVVNQLIENFMEDIE